MKSESCARDHFVSESPSKEHGGQQDTGAPTSLPKLDDLHRMKVNNDPVLNVCAYESALDVTENNHLIAPHSTVCGSSPQHRNEQHTSSA